MKTHDYSWWLHRLNSTLWFNTHTHTHTHTHARARMHTCMYTHTYTHTHTHTHTNTHAWTHTHTHTHTHSTGNTKCRSAIGPIDRKITTMTKTKQKRLSKFWLHLRTSWQKNMLIIMCRCSHMISNQLLNFHIINASTNKSS